MPGCRPGFCGSALLRGASLEYMGFCVVKNEHVYDYIPITLKSDVMCFEEPKTALFRTNSASFGKWLIATEQPPSSPVSEPSTQR